VLLHHHDEVVRLKGIIKRRQSFPWLASQLVIELSHNAQCVVVKSEQKMKTVFFYPVVIFWVSTAGSLAT
jgi:hypothetical protein